MTPLLTQIRLVWARVHAWINRTTHRIISLIRRMVHRLRDRWDTDTTFRRTLTNAFTAITTTALPNTPVAVGVSALLNERHTTYSTFDDEDYPRAWTTHPWDT